MSDIIAGDPAPTNPTAAIRDDILAGLRIADDGAIGDETPEALLDRYDAAKRLQILAECVDAARSALLSGESDIVTAYNRGVTSAVDRLTALAAGGAR